MTFPGTPKYASASEPTEIYRTELQGEKARMDRGGRGRKMGEDIRYKDKH
jgi:hypothetical protein